MGKEAYAPSPPQASCHACTFQGGLNELNLKREDANNSYSNGMQVTQWMSSVDRINNLKES